MIGLAVPLIRLRGTPAELGFQHGQARAERLREFLDDSLARLNRILPAPVSLASLASTLDEYRDRIAEATPALAEEIDGLAAGAGISRDEALLLQLRREIMGYLRIPTAGDCTTYARSDADPVLAQTVDLNGNLDDHIAVLDVIVCPPPSPSGPPPLAGSPRRALVLSFGGLLGYVGMNSAGLAVGLNLVLGGDWRPGLPPYLAIRHLLDNASTVEAAIGMLGRLRLASSRSITLCDRSTAAYVEILGDDVRVTRAPWTVHTNHFLHPDLAPRDELNVFARNSSLRRLATGETGLAALPAGADADEHFGLMSGPPIRVPDEGDIRRERTVASVVMFPTRGEIHVRPGDPALSRTYPFTFD
jgi:isopenicillin-N N-acyltransferase like protein